MLHLGGTRLPIGKVANLALRGVRLLKRYLAVCVNPGHLLGSQCHGLSCCHLLLLLLGKLLLSELLLR